MYYTHLIKYNIIYQILLSIFMYLVIILFVLDTKVLAEEISETHQKLRNQLIEEIYRDYYNIDYNISGGPYKRPLLEDITLTPRFYELQTKLIFKTYQDYLLNDYPTYTGFTEYKYTKLNNIPLHTALQTNPIPPEDYINPKSPVMRLAYCIKAENIYYLTQAEILGLRSFMETPYFGLEPIILNIFYDMFKYGYYTPKIIPFTAEFSYTNIIENVEIIASLMGDRPYLRHIYYDLNEQQLIYNICKDGYIPKERLVEYFQSEAYSNLINKIKYFIFNSNTPF